MIQLNNNSLTMNSRQLSTFIELASQLVSQVIGASHLYRSQALNSQVASVLPEKGDM